MTPREYWDNAAKDPDVRYKYICDREFDTDLFIQLIEQANNKWDKVLEIGCGVGRLLEPLSDNHETCHFYGIDVSPEMLKLAPKKPNITYNKTGRNLDLVYSMLVFQHISEEDKTVYIKMAYDLLKKNGVLYFQFVVGSDNDGLVNYQTNISNMVSACQDAGFSFVDVANGYMHPQWCFIKAVK